MMRTSRRRRSNAELAELDDAIYAAVAAEHPVTLRSVYYRVVSAGAVEKTEREYEAVQRRLLEMRRSGRVPYAWVLDGSRTKHDFSGHRNAVDAVNGLASYYRRSLWQDQPEIVMLVTEKDALTTVLDDVVWRWQLPMYVVRGYSSESFAYAAAGDVRREAQQGKLTHVLQLGDLDPSGVDAWRVFQERIRGFAGDVPLAFERLAVTRDQVDALGLPTRPTKTSDSRAAKFEGESVEVDAIAPTELRRLVDEAIQARVDDDVLAASRAKEQRELAWLRSVAEGVA